jgi:UDP:flavonoid glycosyltransferase YjiC (YdhE family)
MQHKLTAKRFWQIAEKRLKLTDLPPLPSTKERTPFLAALPERLAREPVQDWLKRCQVGSAKIIPFPQPKRLLPLAEITRLAADSGLERYPLPDPGRFLESDDGRFRLKIIGEVPETIRIMLQTLGLLKSVWA